jgi:adenine/guanine phosphoribosyltransferase-like PRPP-binding protein
MSRGPEVAVAVLPLSLGVSTPAVLTVEWVEFYAQVAHDVLGGITKPREMEEALTIALPETKDPNVVAAVLLKSLRQEAMNVDWVIIDISNPPRPGYRKSELIFGITSAIKQHQLITKHRIKYVLLAGERFAPEDASFVFLAESIETGHAICIYDNGEISGLTPSGAKYSRETYRRALARVRGEPLETIKRRLIRRIGHFSRLDAISGRRCQLFFYDAEACRNEVRELLGRLVLLETRSAIIFFDPVFAPWLSDIALSFARKNVTCLPITEEYDAIKPHRAAVENPVLFLIVPMVDSGHTVIKHVEALKANFPECHCKVISVLSSRGPAPEHGYLPIKHGAEDLVVEYLLRVEQKSYASEQCPLCRLGYRVDELPPLVDKTSRVSALAMWTMIREAGFESEDNVPSKWRRTLGLIPNCLSIVEKNSAWLCQIIEKRLRSLPSSIPSRIVFVCPSEHRRPSAGAALAHQLARNLAGASYIEIPRTVIDNIPDRQNSQEVRNILSLENETSWYIQLERIRSERAFGDVILVDEFVRSGYTQQRLGRIISQFNTGILAVVCLFNFSDEFEDTLRIEERDVPLVSLYKVILGYL